MTPRTTPSSTTTRTPDAPVPLTVTPVQWSIRPPAPVKAVAELSRALDVTPALAAILWARGVRADATLYLDPPFELHEDPALAAAAERLKQAIAAGERVLIHGDYDAIDGIPPALHFAPMPGTPFIPSVYVDIGGTFELKMEALECHRSQHQYLKQHHGTDIFSQVEAAARTWGAACGVAYAEPFALVQRFNRSAPIQELARFFPVG